ncbi:MAG: DNA repair protein RecN [Candidatus Hydrogenedentes bacterium]|nr:DNA repair protein RecN [Candidatus Hydrogenedentota bacterium]
MLETLRIQNYALIDEVEIDFRQGFNVLTGETGAGKSILVGALNLVLGARAAAEVVREGGSRAQVEAVFRMERPPRRLARLLKQHAISLEEGCLLLSRVVGADGRSKAYAAGSMVPVGVLAEIGDELVDFHGQHEHQSLLKAECQLDLLDAFGGTEAAAEAVGGQVERLRSIEQEIRRLEADDRDRTRQLEFLRFELNEIDAAGLQSGEQEEIRSRLSLITNAEKIFNLATHAHTLLYEGNETAAIDVIDAASREIDALAQINERFKVLSQLMADVRAQLEAVADELRVYTTELEFDPEELERLNARNALLGTLKRKYGATIEDILAYRDRIAGEIEQYEHRDERLEVLRREHAALETETLQAARLLSQKRKTAARRLDQQVTHALQELAMKGGSFDTQIVPIDLCSHGVDRVEFLLAANPGEKPKPLRQVASGGEISRIMLALKAVFAQADQIPTLIFDEIDAGVGGAVARHVAEKLQQLARSHQVICITHLSQIAAVADAHFSVSKKTVNGRTTTKVEPVDTEQRIHELARLLDGSLSDVSLQHARSLLKETGGSSVEKRKRK